MVFAVIAPVELTAEQPVTITAICEAGESEPRDIPGKHFSEGHTTPIAYHIPAIGRYYTRLNFSLPADKGTATLGEAVGKITLTAPEGSLFDNGTNIRQFTPDAEGKYTMVLKPSWTDNLSGKTVTVQYESESAVVSNTLTMPQITEFGNNDITFSVPYLLAEDFSNIIQFDYDCNVGTGTSSSSAGNKDAHLHVRQGLPSDGRRPCGRGNREMYPKLLPVRRRRSRQGFIVCPLPGTYRLAARQRYQIRQNSQSPGFIRLRRRTGRLDDGQ